MDSRLHLLHGYLTSARALVDDVLYKVRIASHMSYIFYQMMDLWNL